VLALVKRGRKVSFGEACYSLELSGVRTYVIQCMKLTKGDKDSKARMALLTCFYGLIKI
jgi:hypothetical protein